MYCTSTRLGRLVCDCEELEDKVGGRVGCSCRFQGMTNDLYSGALV